MDVRVDEITGIRFVRAPHPFPSFAGRESLMVQFLGPDQETVLAIATSRGWTEAPSWPLPPDHIWALTARRMPPGFLLSRTVLLAD